MEKFYEKWEKETELIHDNTNSKSLLLEQAFRKICHTEFCYADDDNFKLDFQK